MALYGFKGLGWFVCGVIVAPACYMVTSQGAVERAHLRSVESAIAQARKEIRALDIEFNSRANMAQLEAWKNENTSLAAPGDGQYLASEAQLADLDKTAVPAPQMASLTAPANVPALEPQPAVETRPVPAQPKAPARLARAVAQLDLPKARTQAVAMLDDRLLSASTINELQERARAEQLRLR